MIGGIAKRLFGSANDRYIASLGKIVEEINGLEASFEALSDAERGRLEANEHLELALQLRRLDDEGKHPDLETPPIEAFREVVVESLDSREGDDIR